MFSDPNYRDTVMQELFLFKAKLLAVIGQMNARGCEKPTQAVMEKTLGVYRCMLEAWVAGDMFEIEIRRFDLGQFREEGEESPDFRAHPNDGDSQINADDLPF